jgi:hypothetical protein
LSREEANKKPKGETAFGERRRMNEQAPGHRSLWRSVGSPAHQRVCYFQLTCNTFRTAGFFQKFARNPLKCRRPRNIQPRKARRGTDVPSQVISSPFMFWRIATLCDAITRPIWSIAARIVSVFLTLAGNTHAIRRKKFPKELEENYLSCFLPTKSVIGRAQRRLLLSRAFCKTSPV